MDLLAPHESAQQRHAGDTTLQPIDLGIVLLQSKTGVEELAQPRAGLSLPQRRLLSMLDGRRSLQALSEADAGLQAARLGRDAQRLVCLGLAEVPSTVDKAAPVTTRASTPNTTQRGQPKVVRAPGRTPAAAVALPRRTRATGERSAARRLRIVPISGVALALGASVMGGAYVYRADRAESRAAASAAGGAVVQAPAALPATQAQDTAAPAPKQAGAGAALPAVRTPSNTVSSASAPQEHASAHQRPPLQLRAAAVPTASSAAVAQVPGAKPAPSGKQLTPQQRVELVPRLVAPRPTQVEQELARMPQQPASAARTERLAAPTAKVATLGEETRNLTATQQAAPAPSVEAPQSSEARGQEVAATVAAPPLRVPQRHTLEPVERVQPAFPRDSGLRSGESVTVHTRLLIAVDGSVERVELLNRNDRTFERAAISALQRWRFPVGASGRQYEAELVFRAE